MNVSVTAHIYRTKDFFMVSNFILVEKKPLFIEPVDVRGYFVGVPAVIMLIHWWCVAGRQI